MARADEGWLGSWVVYQRGCAWHMKVIPLPFLPRVLSTLCHRSAISSYRISMLDVHPGKPREAVVASLRHGTIQQVTHLPCSRPFEGPQAMDE